ncbi:SDR family NAD(P)-dependent oxidoreductase [Mangrovihabitans endophyticus]|uniref:Short-chain dehydrogenase n=1 Tax=Mangrovihabitans endophyticus TaxID=1751298 RepID=A0A8J3C758_9ACTN|nr:SDR family oxidoreductase [Mangrovihabitans endophyticus]GGL15193.1 short-chain dehydrogenase [Mangrovihabitans endophyticus]
MRLDITGKTVVVTGAAQGIGRALALGLAAEGARVAVLARDRKRAQAVVDDITGLPGSRPALALEADVSDDGQMRTAATELTREFGGLDVLINNAGWMGGRQRVLDTDPAVLDRGLRSNLIGNYIATKHFAPIMIGSGGGRIVFMTTGAQLAPGGAAYAGAKAAVEVLTNVVHQELRDQGVRTVAIAPGLTETEGMKDVVTPEHLARVAATYPHGRVGQPEDLVGLVAFLCSDASQHLSGTVIKVRPTVGA